MKFLTVDGNSILNRSFYGIRSLTTKSGVPTNAIFGFLKVMNSMIKETEPDCVTVAFDLRAPTFRHKQYAEYKANRKGMPDELAQQMPIAKEILALLGYHTVELEGYEADDILGTFARLCTERGAECVIATGDRDSLQLVNDKVTVRLATNQEAVIYDPAKIMEVYGVEPKSLIQVKALMGDSSDNIPGVKGIGEKTALELIQKYGDIDKIFDSLDDLEMKPRTKTLLSAPQGRETAYLSRELACICDTVPINEKLDDYMIKPADLSGLKEKLVELEMFSLLSMYSLDSNIAIKNEIETRKITVVLDPDIEETADILKQCETLDFLVKHEDGNMRLLLNIKNTVYVFADKAQTAFETLVANSEKPKRTHGVKPLYLHCLKTGQSLSEVTFDLELAAYLLNPSASGYEINSLMAEYANDIAFEIDGEYLDIAALPLLCDVLQNKLFQSGMSELLHKIELPLSEVLASMEYEGFLIDAEGIAAYGKELEAEITVLAQDINELAGQNCNPNSPKELGHILFEKLGLKGGKKTKTGFSTNAETLEKLKNAHPIVEKILQYRQLAKLNSTYVVGLLKAADEQGRIHTYFKQTETRTGRISSVEPNLQNIPVRTKRGSVLRKFFIAPVGRVLLDADYSQIELRILAAISGDEQMADAFNNGDDIHAMTASEVFGIPLMILPPEMRSRAKAINFGIVYGISAFSLSADIGVTVGEAKKYIDRYFETYPGVKAYMDGVVKKAKEDGYVSTIFGRRRPLPDINASNHIVRSAAERIALNAPIQGTSADIIKIAMIGCYNRLKREIPDAKLILQIHDELIIEADEKDADSVAVILKEEMENAAKLSVKLEADVNVSGNWYGAKGNEG